MKSYFHLIFETWLLYALLINNVIHLSKLHFLLNKIFCSKKKRMALAGGGRNRVTRKEQHCVNPHKILRTRQCDSIRKALPVFIWHFFLSAFKLLCLLVFFLESIAWIMGLQKGMPSLPTEVSKIPLLLPHTSGPKNWRLSGCDTASVMPQVTIFVTSMRYGGQGLGENQELFACKWHSEPLALLPAGKR